MVLISFVYFIFFGNCSLTKPDMAERPTPNVPRDDLLATMLMKFPHMVYKYHEHDSLLENKGEEELSEQEKNDAWAAYELDVKRKNESNMGPYNNSFGMLPNYSGLGTYANSLFNNYNNLSGVSGLNYPYNMYPYASANPYASDYNQMRFSDFSAFYNNLMNVGSSSMANYNQNSSNLMSPNHPTSVSSPPPIMNMNNFPSSRNWMQSNASSSSLANSLLSSFAQSSSSSKSSYSSYLNSIYNALGTNNVPQPPNPATTAPASKSPPLPLSPLAYHQKQNTTNPIAGSNPISSTTSLAASLSASQQGPNAIRNPMLTKELLLPRNPTLSSPKDVPFNLPIPTSVITKSTTNSTSPLPITSSAAGGGGGSHQNDTSKASSKSPDSNISSSVDKTATKSSKSSADNSLLIIKDVRTINKESRDSPDTTAANQALSKSTDKTVSNGVSSSMSKILIEAMKKPSRDAAGATPVSSNMGIVYPPKPAQASTSKTSPNSSVFVTTNTKGELKQISHFF